MNSKGTESNSKTIVTIIDEDYEDELFHSITESRYYQSQKKHLPEVSAIVYLYIKDNMKFACGKDEDGVMLIQEGNIDEFLLYLHRKAVVDISALQLFIASYEMNFTVIKSKISYDDKEKKTLLSVFLYVVENYWECRLNGAYDKAMDIERYLTAMVYSNPGREAMKALQNGVSATITDYSRHLQSESGKKTIEPLKVNKPEDLTLIIDYSFENTRNNASYCLKTDTKKLRISRLFKQGELNFLIHNIVNPLTLNGEKKISAGQSVQISDSVWDIYGCKRIYQVDHINTAIRQYIKSVSKLRFFSQKNRSIDIRINILIENMTFLEIQQLRRIKRPQYINI